jgi:hypothetical protein
VKHGTAKLEFSMKQVRDVVAKIKKTAKSAK